jgi:hypothetical protein
VASIANPKITRRQKVISLVCWDSRIATVSRRSCQGHPDRLPHNFDSVCPHMLALGEREVDMSRVARPFSVGRGFPFRAPFWHPNS